MKKSKSVLNKELDIHKFLIRQRIQTHGLLGLLNNRQSKYVDKMSQLIIRESTDFDESSADSELSDWQKDNMDYVRRMASSRDLVDKRLTNIYMIRKAHQNKTHFGFENDLLVNRRASFPTSHEQKPIEPE